jgi:hypothetical protein
VNEQDPGKLIGQNAVLKAKLEKAEADLADAEQRAERLGTHLDTVACKLEKAREDLSAANIRYEGSQDALREAIKGHREVVEILAGKDCRRPSTDVAKEARLALDLNETVQQRLGESIRRLRILLAWSNGTLILHEAAAMLGVEPGELWGLERSEMEALKAERE